MTRLACVLALALLPRVGLADTPLPPLPPDPPPSPAPGEPAAEPAPSPPSPGVETYVEPRPTIETPLARPGMRSRELRIEVPGERTRTNKLVVGGLLATGVIASAFGVYWHLDSRDAADAVSAKQFTGEAWTAAHVALVDQADRSKTRATIAYTIGGAFLIGAVATFIATAPSSETAVIRTGVVVAPTTGGTIVGRTWSF